MSWQVWIETLRNDPSRAVADLLRGSASISPFERVSPHEFLLVVLPRSSRQLNRRLLGEPESENLPPETASDLTVLLDRGLSVWLSTQREAALPPVRKLGAYAVQVSEALQWPLYFALPQTRSALQAERARWLGWLSSLTLTAYRDPEFDYWQVLAAQQADASLQSFWQLFVGESGRTRSSRYLNLGLLALARLPLSEDDSGRNLRLQVQALVNRHQRRKRLGVPAQQELAEALRDVMARNPSMAVGNYRAFMREMLSSLGNDQVDSLLSLLGLGLTHGPALAHNNAVSRFAPPAAAEEARSAVESVRRSSSLAQAWKVVRPLLVAHEDFFQRSGDPYYFVRTLDNCVRALCNRYALREPEIQSRLFQWVHLALRLDADNPRLWMLWELVLRQAGQPQRAQWVLWEMSRRFPDNLQCRTELALLLTETGGLDDLAQAHRLLQQVLELAPHDGHAYSVLAKLAIRLGEWDVALAHTVEGLRAEPNSESCAVLQASAYARRAGEGDLKAAIECLERFAGRYPGSLRAEDYLRELQDRQQSQAQGTLQEFENDFAETTPSPSVNPETDPAWVAFAQSIQDWLAYSASLQAGQSPSSADLDRVLPLPQAMKISIEHRQWDANVLGLEDAESRLEFSLETRLWRYLRTLHVDTHVSERKYAWQALAQWLESERREPSLDNPSWLPYLEQHKNALQADEGNALAAGEEWLRSLLDRYQPLPTPLMA